MWNSINTAPKDRPILVWHKHNSDSYYDSYTGMLTDYGAHSETLSNHVKDGPYQAVWAVLMRKTIMNQLDQFIFMISGFR